MGKRTKLREAQKRVAEQELRERLRARRQAEPRQGFISTFAEFAPSYRAKVELYRQHAVRAPESWSCRLRVRSPELRFLDLVRFTFAQFPVPQHLEQAWTKDLDGAASEAAAHQQPVAFEPRRLDYCYWYIVAAQGKSLFREVTQHFNISRRETHYFLNAPSHVTGLVRAFWYGVAMAANPDVEVAVRVSRTRLAAYPVAWKFWQDVARFFACNPMPLLEMNDFIDYFQAAKDLDDTFEVHGRSLPALRRRMEEWETEWLGTERWTGRPIPDAVYWTEGEHGPAIWRMHQITDDRELYREGERMRHCVFSYRLRCMESLSSIWSLTCEHPIGTFHRGITVEVDKGGAVVQCRGFANRAPSENELAIVRRWAGDHGLTFPSWRY
jgi:hypothetical protein